ncbi:MAG: TniQ family protein [Pseudonocardiaceae bacterium]
MKPAVRWPLHPAPRDGEMLSSWLSRIATSYQMGVGDLLEHGLGYDRAVEHYLALKPPPALLDMLAERTGVDPNRLREMSLEAVMERTVQRAREDPAEAQALFDLLVIGCRTPQSIERLEATLTALGVPTAHLSHNPTPGTIRMT